MLSIKPGNELTKDCYRLALIGSSSDFSYSSTTKRHLLYKFSRAKSRGLEAEQRKYCWLRVGVTIAKIFRLSIPNLPVYVCNRFASSCLAYEFDILPLNVGDHEDLHLC